MGPSQCDLGWRVWAEAGKILILPSILFIVTNERISRIHEMMEDENGEAALTPENDETEEEIIRGGEEVL